MATCSNANCGIFQRIPFVADEVFSYFKGSHLSVGGSDVTQSEVLGVSWFRSCGSRWKKLKSLEGSQSHPKRLKEVDVHQAQIVSFPFFSSVDARLGCLTVHPSHVLLGAVQNARAKTAAAGGGGRVKGPQETSQERSQTSDGGRGGGQFQQVWKSRGLFSNMAAFEQMDANQATCWGCSENTKHGASSFGFSGELPKWVVCFIGASRKDTSLWGPFGLRRNSPMGSFIPG